MQNQQIPSNFLDILSEVCQSSQPIPKQLIAILDTLSMSFSSEYQKQHISICNDAWSILQNSSSFWQKASSIINTSGNHNTIFQILVIAQKRVRDSWIYEAPETRSQVKALMCNYAFQYQNIQETGANYKPQFNKINCILAQILKYQWNNQWANFLSDILTAMQQSVKLAQNYFNLIKIVFQEIFIEDQKLTTSQIKAFKQRIDNDTILLFSTFQMYFNNVQSEQLARNCLSALEVVIPTLNPPKIYLNFSFEKMIELLSIPAIELQVMNCLIILFRMKYDKQIEKIIKSKVTSKKQEILVEILRKLNPCADQGFRQKVVDLASEIVDDLQEQLKSIKQNQYRQIFLKSNIFISAKLSQIMASVPVLQSDLRVYDFITKYIHNFDCSQLVNKLISLANCPYDLSLFLDLKVFKNKDYVFDQSFEAESKKIRQITQQIIKNCKGNQQASELRYTEVLIEQMKQELKDAQDLKYFCKIWWHFYGFLDQSSNFIDCIYMFADFLNCADQKYEKNKKDFSKEQLKLQNKILLINRANFLIILSHERLVNNFELNECFFIYLRKCFSEGDNIVIFALNLLKYIGKNLQFIKIKTIIYSFYEIHIKNRKNRIVFDQLFVDFLYKRLEKHQNQFEETNTLIQKIMEPYIQTFKSFLSRKTPIKAQFTNLKCQLIQISYKLLSFYNILLKYPFYIQKISKQSIEQLQSLLAIKKLSDKFRQTKNSQRFRIVSFQVQNQVLLQILPNLKEQEEIQIKKNILQIIFQNINSEISLLSPKNFNSSQQNQELIKLLNLLSDFIKSLSLCNGNDEQKLEVITNIIDYVNGICFQCLHKAHIKYFLAIIKSKYFEKLDADCISNIIYQIFDYALSQVEDYVLLAHEALSTILSQTIEKKKLCVENSPNRGALEKFIVHFTCKIFKIILSPKLSKYFLQDFCQLLYLSLEVVKSMRYKLHPNQPHDNFYEILLRLIQIIKSQFDHLRGNVIQMLIESFIKKIKNTSNFTKNMRDFLVQARRGYIQVQFN